MHSMISCMRDFSAILVSVSTSGRDRESLKEVFTILEIFRK